MNERTLTVRGVGNVKTQPDLIVITITLTTTTPNYSKTTELAALELENVKKAIVSAGHKEEALKTSHFDIKTENESYIDAAGNRRSKFTGYSATHRLKLELDLDMALLNETIVAISTCGANPIFKISFSIKDKNAVETELLEKAVANAKEKAIVLARATGIKLGVIKHINYSWGELHLYSDTHFDVSPIMEIHSKLSIAPEEIEVDDGVTVIWGIE